MEHALQTLCAIAIISAFIREWKGRIFPWWGIAAILLGPLVRYENLAISFLAIIVLFYNGKRKIALFSTLFIIVTLACFSLFLNHLHLGFFPSSIVAKSRLEGRGTFPFSLFISFANNLKQRQGPMLIILLGLILVKLRFKNHREIIFIVAGAVLAHLAAGDIMGRRYTVYMLVIMLLTIFYLYKDALTQFFETKGFKRNAIVGVVLLITATLASFETARIPLASNNIYEQQYQMHRLAKLYGKPVAINDLGFVSFRNDAYVLDLWGLASLKALKLRNEATSPDWPETLCAEHNVGLVMVYDDWFRQRPVNWMRVGDITLSRKRVAPAGETVAFYARSQSDKDSIIPVLNRFKTTVPHGVKVNIYP